jgi:hypothetical protein
VIPERIIFVSRGITASILAHSVTTDLLHPSPPPPHFKPYQVLTDISSYIYTNIDRVGFISDFVITGMSVTLDSVEKANLT